jgi:uncharacterized protein (TIGR00159 family)
MEWLPSISIGFLEVTIWDLLDILIVGWLLSRIYRLLRGSIALNIVLGILVLYVAGWVVEVLDMDMLSGLLSRFVNVGFIIVIIIFQPEVRRFLLLLGKTTLSSRHNILRRWLSIKLSQRQERQQVAEEMRVAVMRLSMERTGALLVFSHNIELEAIGHSAIRLDANIHHSLLLSIFHRESPLHDGAVVISDNKLVAAGCILPVSESGSLPDATGLRHRAGLGVTERTQATCLVISEETGIISYAEDGRLEYGLSEQRLQEILQKVPL